MAIIIAVSVFVALFIFLWIVQRNKTDSQKDYDQRGAGKRTLDEYRTIDDDIEEYRRDNK